MLRSTPHSTSCQYTESRRTYSRQTRKVADTLPEIKSRYVACSLRTSNKYVVVDARYRSVTHQTLASIPMHHISAPLPPLLLLLLVTLRHSVTFRAAGPLSAVSVSERESDGKLTKSRPTTRVSL